MDAGDALVPDCDLPSITFDENPLDVLLLKIFRFLVERHTGPLPHESSQANMIKPERVYMSSLPYTPF